MRPSQISELMLKRLLALLSAATALLNFPAFTAEKPFCNSEIIFPMEHWHNHGSCIVETPKGDLIVCWFHGSGERNADDVKIEGARKRKGSPWSRRFTMADTAGYPDTNCCLLIDPEGQLWLFWPTILANQWETALMKYRISADYHKGGPPKWKTNDVLHLKPGPEFERAVSNFVQQSESRLAEFPAPSRERIHGWLDSIRGRAANKLERRLGWMTRAHPFVLDGKRLIVPLYSDGFSFSLMAITDDWGVHRIRALR